MAIALVAGVLLCRAALATDAARFEAESMSYGSFANVVSSDGASGAKALRFEDDGTATKRIVTSLDSTKVVVRARNSDYSTGNTQQLRVLVDGVEKGTQQLRSRTYEGYTFSATIPAGTHSISVAGLSLENKDAMLVDTVALVATDGTTTGGTTPLDPCDKWASPTGSDSNSGTQSAPYLRAQRLANSLTPGQTGCLEAGTYTEADKEVNISAGGNASARVVLRTAPYELSQARINARVVIGSTADYITLQDLRMDGSYGPACAPGGTCTILPSPTINGDYTHLIGNDISNRRPGSEATLAGICNNAGSGGTRVTGLRFEDNLIHDCGRLPRSNYDHGIYLGSTDGAVVQNNTIRNNSDRGVKLGPNADGTLVDSNVIDRNGTGLQFSGDGTQVSSDNVVRNNVISNSQARWNVEEYWGTTTVAPATGNIVHDNCVWASNANTYYDQNDGVQPNAKGFVSYQELRADPLYDTLGQVGATSACHDVYG